MLVDCHSVVPTAFKLCLGLKCSMADINKGKITFASLEEVCVHIYMLHVHTHTHLHFYLPLVIW